MDYCGEIEVPVPWGHIAGKHWGNKNGKRLLLIHGKQDNCGVYDRLIKLLHGNYCIIAFDLPGHGFSSSFPNGVPVELYNYVIAVYCVIEYVHWDKFFLVGHSLGAYIGFYFTAIFSEYVERFVAIDHIVPNNMSVSESITTSMNTWITDFVKFDKHLKKGKAPTYDYKAAVTKMTHRASALNTDAAKIVLERSLRQVGDDKYELVMDQRLKLPESPLYTTRINTEIVLNVTCPVLLIFSSERSPIYEQSYKYFLELLKRKKSFVYKVVPGNHDVHQNHPERVSPLIDEFLLSLSPKL